jgi:hypothetical protein
MSATAAALPNPSPGESNANLEIKAAKLTLRGAVITAILSALVALLAAIIGPVGGYFSNLVAARDTAADQATADARSYLTIFSEMQGGLDSDIQFRQKIYEPVFDRAWNINIDDLKSLGVVLSPTALNIVERASQKINLVFPPSFAGEPAQSTAAHQAFRQSANDIQKADELVRCAEIYLGRVPGVVPIVGTSGRAANEQLTRCNTDPAVIEDPVT